MSSSKFREVLFDTSNLFQTTYFYYGNSQRLKGILRYHFKERCYELTLYKGGGDVYFANLYMDDSKTKEELYEEVKKDIKKYEEICLY